MTSPQKKLSITPEAKKNDTPAKKTSRPLNNQSLASNNESRILNEAKKLFRQRGFSGVSINHITTASEVSKPTLYHYFGDKENLYAEVMIDMLKTGSHYLQQGLRKSNSVREKLYDLTEGFMTHSPTSMTAMMRDAKENLGEISFKKVADAYRYYMVSTFELLFSQGIDSGELKALESTDMALLFMSLIDGYTCNRTSYSGRHFDYKTLSRFLVDSLMDGLAKPANRAV